VSGALNPICRRKEPIIAIGGGVCLDVAGLSANLYRRNTPIIKVCTCMPSVIGYFGDAAYDGPPPCMLLCMHQAHHGIIPKAVLRCSWERNTC
jgi:hypothetical protein